MMNELLILGVIVLLFLGFIGFIVILALIIGVVYWKLTSKKKKKFIQTKLIEFIEVKEIKD